MNLQRRTFLKFIGLAGVFFTIPGLAISDIIPKTGKKNVWQARECKSFGEFLIGVASHDNSGWPDGYIPLPTKFVKILQTTAKKAGVLGRLKGEKFHLFYWATEELLLDSTALGHFAWYELNKQLSIVKHPGKFKSFGEQLSAIAKADELNGRVDPRLYSQEWNMTAKVSYIDNEQCFKFVLRAI